MLRTGLRNDDVQALVREVRAARDEGLGPDEAWSRAKKTVVGVEPEVFDAWREEVEKQAEGGTAQVSRVTTTTNILARVTEQDEEISRLKRKLAEAGAQAERAVSPEQVAEFERAYKALEEDRSKKGAELSEAKMEIARLTEKLATSDKLYNEAVERAEKLNADLAATREQLTEAEDLLKKPSGKK